MNLILAFGQTLFFFILYSDPPPPSVVAAVTAVEVEAAPMKRYALEHDN